MSQAGRRVVQRLSQLFQATEKFSLNPSVLNRHSFDESFKRVLDPLGVCFPTSTEEVSQIMKICSHEGLAVVPFGTGTGLEGGICSTRESICISMAQMNKILRINQEDFDVAVEAGVQRKQLNHELRETGLMFPIDPGADACLGGMLATSASGTNAVRYGTMRENVLNLEVVLANGRVVQTAGTSRARKTAAGYNLTNLFVGSEGTLGIITKATLKLHPIPQSVNVAICNFATVKDAVETVIDIRRMGIPIARVEFLDDRMMQAVNTYSGVNYEVKPGNLFLEFHGSSAEEVSGQVDLVSTLAREHQRLNWSWATEPEDRAKLWQARHNAYYAAKNLRPGATVVTTDVCVPISRLSEVIVETKNDILQTSLHAPLVGHVGDGNFHTLILFDEKNPEEVRHKDFLYHRMIERAIKAEGTCTGEHGVGMGKKKFLAKQAGDNGIWAMSAVKQALDPLNIMNPGKVFDL